MTDRSGNTSEELQKKRAAQNQPKSSTNENEGHEEVQSDLVHDLSDWLQEFRENLVDEKPMESRTKVEPGSGDHTVHTHFPKDPEWKCWVTC